MENYAAKRLYTREIVMFCLIGAILLPIGTAPHGAARTVVQMCALLAFAAAFAFFAVAAWGIRPLHIDGPVIQFGHANFPVERIHSIEFRPGRKWLVITMKSRWIPRVRVIKIVEFAGNDGLAGHIRRWATEQGVPFHPF